MAKSNLIFSVFSVRCGDTFWAPIVGPIEQVKTDFIFAINHSTTELHKLADSSILFQIGFFDAKIGKFQNIKPKIVLEGSKCRLPGGKTLDQPQEEVALATN